MTKIVQRYEKQQKAQEEMDYWKALKLVVIQIAGSQEMLKAAREFAEQVKVQKDKDFWPHLEMWEHIPGIHGIAQYVGESMGNHEDLQRITRDHETIQNRQGR